MSIFSIGLSGLRAAQAGLHTTSNNISNVGTDGYNREILQLSESRTSGVETDGIQRQFNQFVATRLNAASGSYASLETYYSQVRQIDNLLSDERSGLNSVMESFLVRLANLQGTLRIPLHGKECWEPRVASQRNSSRSITTLKTSTIALMHKSNLKLTQLMR